jgi:hypothetical protein
LIVGVTGEPEIAVRAYGDALRARVPWDRELGNCARRRYLPDLVALVFDEPDIPIRAGDDAARGRVQRRDRILNDRAGREACFSDVVSERWLEELQSLPSARAVSKRAKQIAASASVVTRSWSRARSSPPQWL